MLVVVQMVKERDMIGSQLVRRNDEVSLLNEKVKILEKTQHKGELQYKERLEDLRVLKLEIRHLRCKNSVLEKSNQTLDDLRSMANIVRPLPPPAALRARVCHLPWWQAHSGRTSLGTIHTTSTRRKFTQ